MTTRFRPHYFLLIRANNSEIQTDSFVVNDFLFSNISKIVKFIKQDPLSQRQYQKNQRQEKVSNWKSKKFLKLFRLRDTFQQKSISSFISDFRVQKLKNFQNSILTISFSDFFHSSQLSRSSQLSYSTKRSDSSESEEDSEEKKQITFNFSRFSKISRSSKSISNTSSDMSKAAEKQSNFSNLTRKNIQTIVMSMFIIFIQNVVVKMNTSIQKAFSKDYFKITNVNFFDFKFEKSYGSDDVVQINRNVYYRNVFIFVKKIKNAVITYEIETIKINLSTCLRDTVQIWYIEDFSDLKKQTLRFFDEKTDHWCEAFIKKFRQSMIFAFQKLSEKKYSLNDVKNHKNISNFVFSIMKHAKAANISDQYSQLIWIFNAITFEIRKDIEILKKIISIVFFLKQLENKRDTWHQIYSRKFEFSYNKFYEKYQLFYFKRYDHDAHEKSSQTNIAREKFFQKFFSKSKKNEKKTSRSNQLSNDDDRKNKIQKTTFSWKNRVSSDEYFEDRDQYRQNKYDKNRDEYQDKNRDYDKKRYKNKYREKTRDYERSDVKFQNAKSQKAYTDSYEYENLYANDESYEEIDFNEKYDDEKSKNQYFYNVIMKSFGVCKKCDIFKKKFKFNNLFHSHIRDCKVKFFKSVVQSFQTSMKISNLFVIEFIVSFTIDNDLNFRNYHFVMIWIIVALLKSTEAVTNTECAVFLIDEKYFQKILFNETIIKMIVSINVKNINNAHKECDIYVFLNLYLNGESKSTSSREYFRREVHVIKDFRCKFFFEMNILKAKQIIINLINKIMIIFTCKDLVVSIKIALKSNARIRRVIHFKNQTVIFFKSMTQISIYMKSKSLSNDRNYFFESNQQQLTAFLKQLNDFYIHVCHDNVTGVHVRNDKNMTVKISRRARLRTLTEYETEECYQIDDEYHEVAMISNIQNMKAWFQNKSNDFTIFEFFHESEIRAWFQNVMNNFTMSESFHDEFSGDFKSNVITFDLIHETSESIHEKLNSSEFSHFFTVIREI